MSVLYDKLREYSSKNNFAFHMPGHKRNERFDFCNPYDIDITEIDGFDDLHQAEGLLKECMDYASACYGSDKTYFLVNGSTCGLLSAISAATNYNDKIIMARNCHKSVYNAVEIRGLVPIYIYPEYIEEYGISGGINLEQLSCTLSDNPETKAVVVVSPTYEGVCSDIEGIAKLVHKFNCLLIVDEAHGAHFKYSDSFPKSALELGADIVIQSIHKTLPSFTQTALLHVKSDRADVSKIEKYLSIYQTSSPSYVFMAAIDKCIRWMESESSQSVSDYCTSLNNLRNRLYRMKNLRIISDRIVDRYAVKDFDCGKIVISFKNFDGGHILYDVLRLKYNIQAEMFTDSYVTLMTSIGDKVKDLQYLGEVLTEIDKYAENADKFMSLIDTVDINNQNTEVLLLNNRTVSAPVINSEIVYIPAIAVEKLTEKILLESSIGRVSGSYIYIYPPGIPMLAPGERISREAVDTINRYIKAGLKVRGLKDEKIIVIKE